MVKSVWGGGSQVLNKSRNKSISRCKKSILISRVSLGVLQHHYLHVHMHSLSNIDTLIVLLRWKLQPALHFLFSCTSETDKATVALRQQPARAQLNKGFF